MTSTPDAPRGILHAASLDAAPGMFTNAYPVNCLKHAGDALFVCQRFAFGRASLEDGAFTPALELSKLETMNQCAGMDTVGVRLGHRFGAPEADETADRLTRDTILRLQADGTCFAGGARWRSGSSPLPSLGF